ncbi:hypothetical protein [Dyella sp. OK004]
MRNGVTRASAISSTILNGCNHLPIVEKPEETERILMSFALSH